MADAPKPAPAPANLPDSAGIVVGIKALAARYLTLHPETLKSRQGVLLILVIVAGAFGAFVGDRDPTATIQCLAACGGVVVDERTLGIVATIVSVLKLLERDGAERRTAAILDVGQAEG